MAEVDQRLAYTSSPLVLASASHVRQRLLAAAGLEFDVVPAGVDEASIRDALLDGGNAVDPQDVAEVLARAKADDVAGRRSDRVIIAADQVLAFDGQILSKPADVAEARANLLALSGHMHELHSAVVVVDRAGEAWAHVDTAHVLLRRLSPEFIGRYLARTGTTVLSSVGCYELEGLGIHLIDRLEGDYFTVLGLPLLAVLDRLRDIGAIEA